MALRIAQLIPGTGSFYCGSCLRDNTLGRTLKRRGHDVSIVPLYLPFMLEDEPTADTRSDDGDVFLGGINLFLQQKVPVLRHVPGFVHRWLDRPGLLRWSSKRGDMTGSKHLGPMTLAMLEGEAGPHRHELDKLMTWLAHHERPDVVLLSNVMLAGMARSLHEEVGCRVVCTVQGEDAFLDGLPDPWRTRAWAALKERVAEIDALIPVSHYYANVMRERLDLRDDRVHVVHNGIDLEDLAPVTQSRAQRSFRIGYLARMCEDKGLHTLVDAFFLLRERGHDVQLHVLGVMLKGDRPYVAGLKRKLSDAGLIDHCVFTPNAERAEKVEFLHSIDVLSVPATYGESFGLYLLEAMACGVPVVQPRHAAFPEIIDATGGGLLCVPDDAAALADGIEQLILDDGLRERLGQSGREAVRARFTADHMAIGIEAVLAAVVAGGNEAVERLTSEPADSMI